MNTQIGKNVNKKFSLHNSSNRNREHLSDLTLWKKKGKTMDLHVRK